MKSYIGITGATTLEQTYKIARQFLKSGFSSQKSFVGMIGYATDWNLIRNGVSLSNPARYPRIKDLPNILHPTQDFGINVIHFLPEPLNCNLLIKDLEALFITNNVYESGLCRTLQLNYATQNVNPEALLAVKNMMPNLQIICQVGKNALANSTGELIKNLAKYAPHVEIFLIDPSQGQGQEIQINLCREIVTAIRESFPQVGIAFAGGLSASNVKSKLKSCSSIIEPPFSIDMESGARDENDQLDLIQTGLYIQKAAEFLHLTNEPLPDVLP